MLQQMSDMLLPPRFPGGDIDVVREEVEARDEDACGTGDVAQSGEAAEVRCSFSAAGRADDDHNRHPCPGSRIRGTLRQVGVAEEEARLLAPKSVLRLPLSSLQVQRAYELMLDYPASLQRESRSRQPP